MHLPLARLIFLVSNSLNQVKFWSAPVAASCQCNGTCMSRDGPRDRIGVKKGSRFSADLRRVGPATAVASMSAVVMGGSMIETTGAEAPHHQQQQPERELNTATIVSLPSIAASSHSDPLNSSAFRRVSTINDFELQNLCDNVFTQTADPHGSRDAGFAPVSAFAAMLCVCPPSPAACASRSMRRYVITRAQTRGKALLNPDRKASWLNATLFIVKLMYMLAPCFVRVFQGNWIPKRCGTARETNWALFMGDTWPDYVCVLCHWCVSQRPRQLLLDD